MKRKDTIRMAMYERVEAYLRFRCAWLTDDKSWLNRPTYGPLPAAVERTLESVCFDCLNAAIETGDWSSIDPILAGDPSVLHDRHIHQSMENNTTDTTDLDCLRCDDCSEFVHPYMVTDTLWEQVGAPDRLCIPCFEARLGRALRQQDLRPDTPANAWMRWSGESLAPLDAAGAWTMLRVASSRFGWKGLTPERVDEAFPDLLRELFNNCDGDPAVRATKVAYLLAHEQSARQPR